VAEQKDLEIIRRTIARELETISQYEQDAAAATDARVRTFLAHLAHEEKEHVAEGMAMLGLLDPRQAELAEKGAHFLDAETAEEAETEPTPAAVGKPPAEPEPPPVPALFHGAGGLTVGNLKRQRRAADQEASPDAPGARHP
jgi:uncharacterized protein